MAKEAPMVGLLIGAKPKKAEPAGGDAAMAAAKAVLAAIKDGDPLALNDALALHRSCCEDDMAYGEETDD